MRAGKKMVVAIYHHPEGYPPTLNAVGELSKNFDELFLVYRPHLNGTWIYPSNVKMIPSGKFTLAKDQEKASVYKKVKFFYRFCRDFIKVCNKNKPQCILLYDPIALFAYTISKRFFHFKHYVWYHNHDVVEIKDQRKFSIGWFAAKAERKAFDWIDIFSLPTDERLAYFNLSKFTGKYFCIPNYPSFSFYQSYYKPKKIGKECRIIFQGRIGEEHGIEEIIELLTIRVLDIDLRLLLKGYCKDSYKKKVRNIAIKYHVDERVEFKGFTPYTEVPRVASECHIGVAIFVKQDLMNRTLGTASNKIYEYAALGLPVLYLKDSGVAKILKEYDWAFPVDLNKNSIYQQLEKIIGGYEYYSTSAYTSFSQHLNFEINFRPCNEYVTTICSKLN